jgi:hypothetical protein
MMRAVLGMAMFIMSMSGGGQQKQEPVEASNKPPAEAQTATAATGAKPIETVKPISALSWLVGGVWTADASKLGPGMKSIETRYQWADNNAYIRFNTHFVFDKGASHTYDGNFFWNPTSKTLAVWYMDAENSITEGPVQVEGISTKIRFRGQDFEGKMPTCVWWSPARTTTTTTGLFRKCRPASGKNWLRSNTCAPPVRKARTKRHGIPSGPSLSIRRVQETALTEGPHIRCALAR